MSASGEEGGLPDRCLKLPVGGRKVRVCRGKKPALAGEAGFPHRWGSKRVRGMPRARAWRAVPCVCVCVCVCACVRACVSMHVSVRPAGGDRRPPLCPTVAGAAGSACRLAGRNGPTVSGGFHNGDVQPGRGEQAAVQAWEFRARNRAVKSPATAAAERSRRRWGGVGGGPGGPTPARRG